jgi:MFS transporter, DHA2 family, multidrug resistance protein
MNARLDDSAPPAAAVALERPTDEPGGGAARVGEQSGAGAAARAPGTAANPATLPNARKYLIFGVMAFGQFMALLDIQIVAASLNDVQAGLSAAPEEISWVQTGYLMAELVMIPLSAFLAQALSTRWLFTLSAALFTISSAMCGIAWDIDSMVLFRVIQGFVGGAMVPTVFATGFLLFTGRERAAIPAILGAVAVLAPTLGPTVGGWLTDVAGWRWIFYINIVPGIVVTVMSATFIRVDTPDLSMLKRIDYAHLAAMAVFLGGLEYVLEEGPRHDWFDEPAIAIAGWVSVIAFALFLERSLRSTSPIVRLSPFRRFNFVFACVFNLVIGFGLYSSIYLIPVFLGRVRDYTSFDIGTTVFVTGIAQLAGTVVSARVSQTVDPRRTITVGLVLFATSLWLTSFITPDWGFAAFFFPQALRGFAIMLCIVPSVTLALTGFAPTELRYASGLFNLMRNLGGAIGIAVVTTWLGDFTRINVARLGEALGEPGRSATTFLSELADYIGRTTPDSAHALLQAQAEIVRVAVADSTTLAFNDIFRLMSWVFLAALVMVPFCRPLLAAATGAPASPPPEAAH